MEELIRRSDCNIRKDEIELIKETMSEFGLSKEKVFDFARVLLKKAQCQINNAPAITTDEVIAYKCPECRVISILYDPENEHFCPNCGIARKFDFS